ncbi:MAG TPA: HEAT repeat domain-containing protein [Enhygromyxa sp.]|nr:HEAT repeat domain-containing protein [Enhygromyxa sp.]
MAAKAPPGYGRNQPKRTALKLWLAVVSTNLVGLFVAVYVSSYLRVGAGDPDVLFIVYYGAMILAGIVDAFWLDELLFKGAFRRSLQGKTGAIVRKNEDVEEVAASLQRPAVSFPVVVVLCGFATYGLFNLVNRGFDSWWRDIGEHAHVLRDPAATTATQQQAILELSVRIRPEVLAILEHELTDGDPEVEAWAAWAIGRHKDNEAMNINRVPALVERVRNGAPQVRREAMIALGRLQHQAIADEMQAALAEELERGEAIDRRLIWALGYLQHKDSLPVLDKALYHPDEDVQRLAAWALSQHRDSGKGREAADLLEQRLPAAPLATKCAIVHSLGVLADERSNLALMHAHDSLTTDQRWVLCESISVFAAPDGEHDREDLLMPRERYSMKTIQAMGAMRATTPEIRKQVEPWLERLIAAPDTPTVIHEAAGSLLSGIREQRNDRAE